MAQGNFHAEQTEQVVLENLLNREEGRVREGHFLQAEPTGREDPELRVIEKQPSFWRTALLAASVSGGVLAALSLVPGEFLSPWWLEAGLKLITGIGASLMSIRLNETLVEHSQARVEITDDIHVRRTRRLTLRRSNERKTSSRGT
jgi:hypothetical protein